jgi:hypothetical protein
VGRSGRDLDDPGDAVFGITQGIFLFFGCVSHGGLFGGGVFPPPELIHSFGRRGEMG